MKDYLSWICAIALVVGLWPVTAAKASLSNESLRSYVSRVGARIESNKGRLFVTSHAAGRGRAEIRLLNDIDKNRLGFYAYGFGNAARASDASKLYEYLLRSNSEMAIGSFFVDKDGDIGYKFLIDTRDPLSFETFQLIYLAMVKTIEDRGPVIMKMVVPGAPPSDEKVTPETEEDEAPSAEPGDAESAPSAEPSEGESAPPTESSDEDAAPPAESGDEPPSSRALARAA